MIRNTIADYLDCKVTKKSETTAFQLCGLGFNQLNENPNAQTDSTIYINQSSASQIVESYKTEFPFDLDLDKMHDPTMEVYDIATRQMTGADAQRDFIRVELFRPVTGAANIYEARKFTVSVGVSGISGDGGKKIKVAGTFYAMTDAIVGFFDTTTLEFTIEKPETAPPILGVLTVTSTVGTASGATKIAVVPLISNGNSYKTKTGAAVTVPTFGQACTSGYTAWDGISEVTATIGAKLLVVEVDGENKAVSAGEAVVVAKA